MGDYLKLKWATKQMRNYWDKYLEYNPLRTGEKDTDAGAFLSGVLEAAGDIIRELAKDIPDPAYVREKVNRIRREWFSLDWTNPLSPGEKERLSKVREAIQGFPTKTELSSKLKDFITAIAYRDASAVQRHLEGLLPYRNTVGGKTKDPYK